MVPKRPLWKPSLALQWSEALLGIKVVRSIKPDTISWDELFFYHTSHLHYVCPLMSWLVFVFILHGDARTHNFSCQAPFFNLPRHAEREKRNIWVLQFLLLPTAGIEPGCLRSKRVASITPLRWHELCTLELYVKGINLWLGLKVAGSKLGTSKDFSIRKLR